jgi:hypothetical protein
VGQYHPARESDNSATLDACYTEDEIAEKVGIPRDTLHSKIGELLKTFPGTNSTKLSKFEDKEFQVEERIVAKSVN